MSKVLLTSDIHLTDKPGDEYRLNFVQDLGGLCRSHGANTVVILGDITDKKDCHTGVFANKVADAFRALAQDAVVYILMGNHDYKDPDYPFFDMLNMHKHIKFVRTPYMSNLLGHTLFLPHAKDPETAWRRDFDLSEAFDWAHFIFMHQTIDGSLASNGQRLDGLPIKLFKKTDARIYSGDIHVPQRVGPVTYIGSPYHVHFGDKFNPRMLLLDWNSEEDLHYDAPQKLTVAITEPDDLNVLHEEDKFQLGDHIKVRMCLGRQDFGNWLAYKREVMAMCEGFGLQLFGIELEAKKLKQLPGKKVVKEAVVVDPSQYFDKYCKREDVDKFTRTVGEEFVSDGN